MRHITNILSSAGAGVTPEARQKLFEKAKELARLQPVVNELRVMASEQHISYSILVIAC